MPKNVAGDAVVGLYTTYLFLARLGVCYPLLWIADALAGASGASELDSENDPAILGATRRRRPRDELPDKRTRRAISFGGGLAGE